VGRQRELLVGPLEAEPRQPVSERGVGLVEDRARGRVPLRQRFAHADLLRALTGEKERDRAHQRTTAEAQVNPPPSAEKSRRSPSLILRFSMASSSAVGTDADDVFPWRSTLM